MAKKKKTQNEEGSLDDIHKTLSEIREHTETLYLNKYIKISDRNYIINRVNKLIGIESELDVSELKRLEQEKLKQIEDVEKSMDTVVVKLKPLYPNAKLPVKKFKLDAGSDAYISHFLDIVGKDAFMPIKDAEIKLKSLGRVLCSLGFSAEIPPGYYGQIVPRSGHAFNHGITILNTPATIDAGYRDEWRAIVVNCSNNSVVLKTGMRICQIIIRKLVDCKFVSTDKLSQSDRNMGGLGSTGVD